tara:strand:- start:6150 stop:6305 length:156 start_codon:yes stop_codon:yes gene_type:complete
MNANTNEEMAIQGKLPAKMEQRVKMKLMKEKRHIKPHQVFIGLKKPSKKKY